ncbi:PH and SEC7 domain-containing protein 4-like isoform X2 [Cinclus cinclus]|uniref:PH and SEC7 domain-containing protein 4-like isoform X2 n=1 Tax=Cinclus cinclus TaxID=127875 RepID=UPI002E0E360E
MLLNTDLHGPRLGRAMSSSEFVTNLSGMMDGQDFPKEQLKALYGSIRSHKLEWATDEREPQPGGTPPTPPKFPDPGAAPGGAGPEPCGILSRKILRERHGKRAPWGRRGWRSFRAELRGPWLLFLRDPPGAPAEVLGLPHALALPHPEYGKRAHVFLLRTRERCEMLCQARSGAELSLWVRGINVAAALCSAPPLPAAVGSRPRFVRPVLPSAPSRCPPEQQLARLSRWLGTVTCQILEHERLRPEGRGRDLEEHREQGEFLLEERQRSLTYVQALGTWLRGDSGDSAALGDTPRCPRDVPVSPGDTPRCPRDVPVSPGDTPRCPRDVPVSLGDTPRCPRDVPVSPGDTPRCPRDVPVSPGDAPRCPRDVPSLTKAHSSPSLVPEPPLGPLGRVRRHISERRATRAVVPKRHRDRP